MATTSLQSLNYRHQTPPLNRRQRCSLDSLPPPSLSFSIKSNTFKTYSLATSSSTSSTSSTTFDVLTHHLTTNNFREADNETRRLLIQLAGDSAVKRGYVFFSEVQFISESDLKAIDTLWRNNSNNKFGYSVQKRLFDKSDNDFTKFFIRVGWMKKLDTEVVQYNYRAFPEEFIWELNDETPEGHLPLTNALRGTQLLSCIFSHPAFAEEEQNVVEEEQEEKSKQNVVKGGGGVFKPNYSF
ncbi:tetrapyrrole-binding protein, chloroplastic [Rutidosis leptorrhynchoides]|uniref:tetrapyrrole-binding protein, chloroplastic n=1 Tax=Rutidosis leptorrhynchoides TaxID=125765 RepID=UPI003A9A6584